MTKTAQWRLHLEKWAASGLSAEDFAEKNGLTVRSLKWWRWKIGDTDAKAAKTKARQPAFAEVVAVPPRAASMFEVVVPGGCVVRVAADFDEGGLRRLLAVLR